MAVTDGHLLDTCVISEVMRPSDPQCALVRSRLSAITGDVFLPVMAVAEINFGIELAGAASEEQKAELRAFLNQYGIPPGTPLPFDKASIAPYAAIRAELIRTHSPRKRRGFKHKHLHQLLDAETRECLEIFERDLMIISIAIQHNLVLATLDRAHGMREIEKAAKKTQYRPMVEYWP